MDLVSLFPAATLAQVKAKIAGFAELGGLLLTAWQVGDPGEQFYQAISLAIEYYTTDNAQAIRGFYLESATDPGDEDPYSPANATLDPVPGFLSALGLNHYYTERIGETYATTLVTFTNNTDFATSSFAPGDLVLAHVDDSTITYRNSAAPSLYVGPGGTYSIPANTEVDIAFTAESPGSASNADPGKLTDLNTQFVGDVTCTNASAAIGQDRETAPNYRARCRQQAASVSPDGHPDAYRYLARTNPDGSPLLQSLTTSPIGDGVTAVNITRVAVSGSSTTGIVYVYYANNTGAASAVDVAAANENITANVIASPDCVTFIGAAATNVNLVVTWAVEYQATYLGRAVASATVKAGINAALAARFPLYPINGYKVTAGTGTISLEEIRGTVKSGHPAITDVTLSSPVGATSLTAGQVAKLTTPTGTETAV